MRTDPSGNPLPPRLYWRHGRYWYVHRNKWTALSPHYPEALARYGRLTASGSGMDALVDKVMEQQRTRKPPLAKSTLEQYNYAGKLIKTAFAEFRPEDVKQSDVAMFHDQMGAQHPNMANRCLTVLKIVFGYACRWQMIPYNPASAVKPHAEAERDRYMTDGEYAAVRAAASAWCALLMDVLYLTGQRVGDVLKIRKLDVTESGIEFRQQKTKQGLRVAMTDELRLVLAEAAALHGNVLSPYIFHPRGKGTPYTYKGAADAFADARKLAKVEDVTLHDIRAKAITDAEAEGKDPTALAGHATKAMTERYLRLRRMRTVLGPTSIRRKGTSS